MSGDSAPFPLPCTQLALDTCSLGGWELGSSPRWMLACGTSDKRTVQPLHPQSVLPPPRPAALPEQRSAGSHHALSLEPDPAEGVSERMITAPGPRRGPPALGAPAAGAARSLTKSLPRPPVRLLDGGELDLGVQPQAVVEVSGAALGLPDDVEARQAAQAEVLPVRVRQVAPEGLAQGVEGGAEALGVEHVGVGEVGVGGVPPRELLIPTGALTIRKEFTGDY